MPSENISSRKLAVILFADIVGYTGLMQKDEIQASVLLRRFQKELEKNVTTHNGRIVNFYGDGALCVFDIPIDAIRAAMDIQRTFTSEPIVPVRVGVHSGTVTYEAEKIFGNSVNIASRIESMGVPNSILLSKKVRDEVKNNPDLQMQTLGSFYFKNVEEPLEVYAIANEGFVLPKRDELSGKSENKKLVKEKSGLQKWLPLIAILFTVSGLFYFVGQRNSQNEVESPSGVMEKSIAVLPFANMSNDPEQEYFSDGMMEEILNHLVKIKDLKVISRTTMMRYKGTNKSINEIAKELRVAAVLEGSVRRAGDQLRITAQLIDGPTDVHMWSETYDRKMEDVFAIQSEVAQQVAASLKAQIDPEVLKRIEALPTKSIEAYNLYLQTLMVDIGPRTNIRLMEKAIELDPEFAEAYSSLASGWLNMGGWGGDLTAEEAVAKAMPYIEKALEINKNDANSHDALAALELYFNWNFEKAGEEYDKVIELKPSDMNMKLFTTDYLLSIKQFKEALNRNTEAVKNGVPLNRQLAFSQYFNGQYDQAIKTIEQCLANDFNISDANEAARMYIGLEMYEEVVKVMELFQNHPDSSFVTSIPRPMGLYGVGLYQVGRKKEAMDIMDSLKAKSKVSPVGSPAFHVAMIYAQMGDNDEAFTWLEKGFEDHEVEMYWLQVEPAFEPLHNDPRWKPMLYKVGFDVPVKG